jgi:hypothetical protein
MIVLMAGLTLGWNVGMSVPDDFFNFEVEAWNERSGVRSGLGGAGFAADAAEIEDEA